MLYIMCYQITTRKLRKSMTNKKTDLWQVTLYYFAFDIQFDLNLCENKINFIQQILDLGYQLLQSYQIVIKLIKKSQVRTSPIEKLNCLSISS